MSSNIKTASRISIALSSALLATCMLAAGNAFADEPLLTTTVNFDDLNVSAPAGAAVLYDRIHGASKRVCIYSGGWADLMAAACARKATAQAVEKLNLPALTAYYQSKIGRQSQTLTASR